MDRSTVSAFTIRIPAVAVVFEGEFSGDTLTGTWFQSGVELAVTLQRYDEPLVLERPQEPAPPSRTKRPT